MARVSPSESKVLVVLGMHRSGTSAIARCLNLLGAGIGEHLIPANWGNERGFWEDEAVVEADRALLESQGLTWHDPRPLPAGWERSESAGAVRGRVVDIVRHEAERNRLWVVKDPRMSRLLPAWQSVFREVGCEPCYVLALRSPAEVAASQARRDQFSRARSNFLWLRHVLEAERHTRGARRVLVAFDDLLGDWRSVLRGIGRRLEIDWPVEIEAAGARIEGFLSRELKHFSFEEASRAAEPGLSAWVHDTYAAISSLDLESPELHSALDRVSARVAESDLLVGPLLDDLIGELRETRAAVDSEHEGWAQAIAERNATVADLERRIALERAARRGAEEELRSRTLERDHLVGKATALAEVLEAYRSRRAVRLFDRFRGTGDLSRSVAPSFRQLLDDSRIFGGDLRGYALAPSENLRRERALVYPLRIDRSGLTGVLLAPVIDAPLARGMLVVEIVNGDARVVRRAECRADTLRESEPARFEFAPLDEPVPGMVRMRVSAPGVEVPLRIFEWRRSRLGGLGAGRSRAFCALEFSDAGGRS